jgi:nucleoid-associated protein YgaU
MPNDAKLGLIVGVGVVIAVAVVFFRKDQESLPVPSGEATPASVNRPGPSPLGPSRGLYRPVKARTAAQTEDSQVVDAARRHTVQEGETLFSVAQKYFGDKEKFLDIYRANRDVLQSPDPLTPGTELVIPALAGSDGGIP